MAPTDRREDPPLIDQLYAEPWRFEFFQAVRLLEQLDERLGRPRPRTGAAAARVDAVRFAAHQHLGFPASAVQALKRPPDGASHAPRRGRPAPPVMTVNFLGLTGPMGVLPKLYTSYVRERRDRYRDPATAAFLDIFNHRLASLFHRAWEKYRIAADPDGLAAQTFTRALHALMGLHDERLRGRHVLEDEVLLSRVGLFAQQRRTAEGLASLLWDAFQLPIEVIPLVGRWVEVDPDQRFRAGGPGVGARLGAGAVLGARVYDEQGKFRLRIGPLAFNEFTGFDLKLAPSPGELPARGRELVVVADRPSGLHVRAFDPDGRIMVDAPEADFPRRQRRAAEDLKRRLAGLWTAKTLAPSDRDLILSEACTIVGRNEFKALLPDQPLFRRVVELTRLYVGPEFEFDVQLFIKPGQAPKCSARAGVGQGAQMGRYAWLPSDDPAREFGAVFPSPV